MEGMLMSTEKVPLEEEFIDWLYHKKLLSYRTIRRHIATLRRSLESRDLRTYLLATLTDSRERMTQCYYKEFLCEHFSHIILPLLQDEMRSERARQKPKNLNNLTPITY